GQRRVLDSIWYSVMPALSHPQFSEAKHGCPLSYRSRPAASKARANRTSIFGVPWILAFPLKTNLPSNDQGPNPNDQRIPNIEFPMPEAIPSDGAPECSLRIWSFGLWHSLVIGTWDLDISRLGCAVTSRKVVVGLHTFPQFVAHDLGDFRTPAFEYATHDTAGVDDNKLWRR